MTHTAGMALYCYPIWSVMADEIADSWHAHLSSSEPLFSFCNI